MRRLVVIGAVLSFGLLAAWLAAPRGPRGMRVQQLAGDLFVITDDYDGNTAVFIRADGVVLVDTKSVAGGQRLIETIRTLTDKPVTHILNTHEHYDHVDAVAVHAGRRRGPAGT